MLASIARFVKYIVAMGVVCVLLALGARLVVGTGSLWMEIVGAVGIVLLAASALLRPAEVRAALTGRQARYGGNALVMSIAFLLIVGLVNYLGVRHHLRWDVTAQKQFSLSEQTLKILKELKVPVKVMLFFTQGNPGQAAAEQLLKEYAARSNMLTYDVVDPDVQRTKALDYKAGDGTIIFERGTRREQTFGTGEQDFTGALVKVTRDTVTAVYFTTGHQERDTETGDGPGYGAAKQLLGNENYKVGTLNLAMTSTIPLDAAVVIVAGPQKPFAPEEVRMLNAFVDRGGGLMVLAEPGIPDPLSGMLHAYGIDLPDDLVVDPVKSFYGDIASPLVDSYGFHQITKDLGRLTSIFPTTRSLVKVEPTPSDWLIAALASSGPDSWGETRFREQQLNPDPDEKRGPLSLMVVVEPSSPDSTKGRLVIVGDSDFVSNSVIQAVRGVGNVDLFMNSVNYLASEKELISIRPLMPEQRQVVLNAAQGRAILYGSILFVPLVILAAGAAVWWKRR